MQIYPLLGWIVNIRGSTGYHDETGAQSSQTEVLIPDRLDLTHYLV